MVDNAYHDRQSRHQSRSSLVFFSSAFFMWGLVTVVCNSLVSFYQGYYELNYSTVMLLLMAFFLSRVIVSLPTSMVMERVGYRLTLKLALLWCATGSGVLALLVTTDTFELLLFGVFVMASGITALQVVCSPYVSLSAPLSQSTQRQGVATASNSIGTILAPSLLVAAASSVTLFMPTNETMHITVLFIAVALAFLVLSLLLTKLVIADIKPMKKEPFGEGLKRLLKNRQFLILTLVIALYIGGEVIFGTLTISYLADPKLGGLTLSSATQLIAFYWAGMFVGRVWLARCDHKYDLGKLLIRCCILVIFISASAAAGSNIVVGCLLLVVGLLNSTLYPIIYTKALSSAGAFRSQGAAILIMCSVGGALLPMLQGLVVDQYGLAVSFTVPCVIYVLIVVLYHRSRA